MRIKGNNKASAKWSTRLGGCAIGALLAMSGSAWAQLDEVVVTAERRVSNLQDVPVAVTALTGETLDRADIHDPSTLQFKVPNFTFSAFSPGQAIFSMRGISSNDDGAGTENSLAVCLADAYCGRSSNAAFDFFDVEQVEVLRGPQGTLWGKNAIGGTINIRSKKPSLDEWSTRGKIDLGGYNTQNIGAYITGPISDSVAVKFSVNNRNHDGFVINALNGEELLDEMATSWRTQVLWEMSDATELLVTASSQTTDNSDIARIPIPGQDPNKVGPSGTIADGPLLGTRGGFLAAGGDIDGLKSANPAPGFSKSDSDTYSLKLTTEVASGELTYIAASYETLADWEMDSVGGAVFALIDDIYDETEATSHELRWAGSLADNFDLVAGAFMLEEDTDRTEWFRVVGGAPVGNDGYRQINETESVAVFAHADWRFVPDWALSAGARWTRDEKSITSFAKDGVPFPFIISGDIGDVEMATGGVSDSATWEDVSPKVSLNYTPGDDTLVYVSWASGFKSGGFGAAPATVADALNLELEPEEAENIEIGFKAELLDNTLRVNAVVFQTDYKNLQYQRFGPLLVTDAGGSFAGIDGVKVKVGDDAFGQFRTINSGDATINGVELELTHMPSANFTWTAGIGLLDTEQEVNFREYFETDPGRDVIVTRELNRAPEAQYSLGFVWDMPTMIGSWTLSADYSYSAEVRADVLDDFSKEDERKLLDARLAYTPNDANWEFSLWGKNLTDERYFSHVYTVGAGVIGKLGDPALIGTSIAWKY